jgi:hypothetical protein
VKTDFANNIKNEEMKTAVQQGMEQIAINPIAIANAVIYAVSQPEDVEIGDIVIRPSKTKLIKFVNEKCNKNLASITLKVYLSLCVCWDFLRHCTH